MAEKPEQLKVDGIPINRIKTGMAIIFLVIGCVFAKLTYDKSGVYKKGEVKVKTEKFTGFSSDRPTPVAGAGAGGGSGVDIADDGVAVGLGLISGLSLLASAILVSSIKP